MKRYEMKIKALIALVEATFGATCMTDHKIYIIRLVGNISVHGAFKWCMKIQFFKNVQKLNLHFLRTY